MLKNTLEAIVKSPRIAKSPFWRQSSPSLLAYPYGYAQAKALRMGAKIIDFSRLRNFATASLLLLFLIAHCGLGFALPALSEQQAMQLAEKIWQNECHGKVKGLTSWNEGEDCASMGIGHFIWYPEGRRGPYEETFPTLLTFLEKRGATLPSWLKEKRSCPWHVKEAFDKDLYELPMRQLRNFLYETRSIQAQFMVERLEKALPKMLASLPADEHPQIETLFNRLAQDPQGLFVLLDYVNFKGYGTSPAERYAGEGWGLLQVLQNMPADSHKLIQDFVDAAKTLLCKRVKNAPKIRNEDQWLKGWYRRLNQYELTDAAPKIAPQDTLSKK